MSTKRASSALLLDAENFVLILRRGETHPWAAFEPDLPGGVVEKDESHSEGLAREILEETGVEVRARDLKEAGMMTHPDFFHFNQIEHSLFAYRFTVRPEVTISWEHDQFKWVPLNEVKKLEKPVQMMLNKAINAGFFETI